MDFVSALKEAKKKKCGLRPARWKEPWEDRDGPIDLRGCAYCPRRYYNRWYLDFCASGSLRPIVAPRATLLEVKDLLGKWEVITEEELNAGHELHWGWMRRKVEESQDGSDCEGE